MMWIAIVGSRTFGTCACPEREPWKHNPRDCQQVRGMRLVMEAITRWNRKGDFEGIVSGGAKGADSLAEEACDRLGVRIKVIKPKGGPEPFWQRAQARNQRIVDASDGMIAFFAPGPDSPGTTDDIKRAKAKGIPTWVYRAGSGKWADQ